MDLFDKFSSRENLKQAFKYVRNELTYSSLSVSPIDHASITAIEALGDKFFDSLEQCLRDGKYTPDRGFFVYVTKDNLGLRPVCVLSMIDRIVYQAIFNHEIFGFKIDGQLSDRACFAHRINEDKESDNFLCPYFNNWDAFNKSQEEAFNDDYIWKAEFDIQQYYENIPIKRLMEKLQISFNLKNEKILNILKKQLTTWVEHQDLHKGIPQGQNASAVLGNIYLSSLDEFAEKELSESDIVYLRYVDDIILMGKNKRSVLKATERIAKFLRDYNLNLNEKTRVTQLHNTKTIQEMRIISDYEDRVTEIPKDEFTRIQMEIPDIIEKILNDDGAEKIELRNLKYYLKVATNYELGFLLKLIGIIHFYPSLTVLIIRYITDGRNYLKNCEEYLSIIFLDESLWEIYRDSEISEWSRFWILKLLASNKDTDVDGINEEIYRILSSKEETILKIVAFYYEAIRGLKNDLALINRSIQSSENSVEKSLYSFFLINSFSNARTSTIQNHIEKILDDPSHEMNLIGCYLLKNYPKIKIDDVDGLFSKYILDKKQETGIASKETTTECNDMYYIVSGKALMPFNSPASIFGTSRKSLLKNSVELSFPEIVKWEKVTIKIKEGMREVEIFYNNNHIETADYTELGFFSGKKQQKQDRQWGFLCALSVLSATDINRATPEEMRRMVAVSSETTLSTANVHQIKRSLVKKLRTLFKTDDDPFYDKRDYYHPKFTILPEPTLRQDKIWRQGGMLNENINFEDNPGEAR